MKGRELGSGNRKFVYNVAMLMRWTTWLMVICAVALASRAAAATRVEAVFNEAAPEGGWVPVMVTLDVPPPGGVVWVRDVRGGVEFGRPVDAGAGRRILMSVPLIEAERLRGGEGILWQVRVRINDGSMPKGPADLAGEIVDVEATPVLPEKTP